MSSILEAFSNRYLFGLIVRDVSLEVEHLIKEPAEAEPVMRMGVVFCDDGVVSYHLSDPVLLNHVIVTKRHCNLTAIK